MADARPRTRLGFALVAALVLAGGCRAAPASGARGSHAGAEGGLADAHVHLSYGGEDALDSLAARGVLLVRDCGGDFAQLARWRSEIASGARRGPRLLLAGPVIDGPKDGARFRLTVRTPADAERAVDSLAALGVDFVKTHSGVPPEAFFAVLRRARARGLRVAAHLPRGVPAWTAADSGAGSIEHAAESLLQSPVYAGLASDVPGAAAWWRSPAGDSAIARLASSGTTVVPTLVRYEASIGAAATPELRAARAALLPELLALVGRLHRAGVPLLVGSDLVGLARARPPHDGPRREIELLEQAGLTRAEAERAGSAASLMRWADGTRETR